MLLLWLGFLEYVLVGMGVASLIAGLWRRNFRGGRLAIAALVVYAGAQGAAHLLLNLQSVNIRLMAGANP